MVYPARVQAAKCGGDADRKLSNSLITVLECKT
jgi:hypothetical protein